jgi:hypothetical protein
MSTKELMDEYVEKYNLLINELDKADIDLKFLNDLVNVKCSLCNTRKELITQNIKKEY